MRNGAPNWIAVDWGTTHLRAWAMDDRGRALAEARSDDGMAALEPEAFEPALLSLIGPWIGAAAERSPLRVIACGMVGSRQGWVEAPYRAVPCAPLGGTPVHAATRDGRISVHVVAGLRQNSPPDVMRGEETQIAGFLAADPGFDGVICLPGTHSKWAHISAGEVVSFASFMTGELFGLLSEHSVLRHSLGAGWDSAAFDAAVADSLSRPERLAGALFGLRAGGLLGQTAADTAAARLSGLLIGAELAAARPYWLGREVVLIGAQRLSGLYAAALAAQGLHAEARDATEMTLAGLAQARMLAREPAA